MKKLLTTLCIAAATLTACNGGGGGSGSANNVLTMPNGTYNWTQTLAANQAAQCSPWGPDEGQVINNAGTYTYALPPTTTAFQLTSANPCYTQSSSSNSQYKETWSSCNYDSTTNTMTAQGRMYIPAGFGSNTSSVSYSCNYTVTLQLQS